MGTPENAKYKYYVSWMAMSGGTLAFGSMTIDTTQEFVAEDLQMLQDHVRKNSGQPSAALMGFSKFAP